LVALLARVKQFNFFLLDLFFETEAEKQAVVFTSRVEKVAEKKKSPAV